MPVSKTEDLKKFYRIIAGDERNTAVLKAVDTERFQPRAKSARTDEGDGGGRTKGEPAVAKSARGGIEH